MKVKAFITDTKEIDHITKNLNIPYQRAPRTLTLFANRATGKLKLPEGRDVAILVRARNKMTATAPSNRWPANSSGGTDESSMQQSYVSGSSACLPRLGASPAQLVTPSFCYAL